MQCARNVSGKNLLLLFCAVIFTLGTGEIVARYAGFERLPTDRLFHTVGRKGSAGSEYNKSCDEICIEQGHNTHLSFNDIGIRDIDHKLAKPEGVKRIIVLGDSQTSGQRVPIEQTGFRQLQSLLNEHSSEQWEVISLAQSGFGTFEEVLMLEEYGFAYDPDVVVIQIYPNNDICDNTIEGFGICSDYPFRPYMFEVEEGLKRTAVQPIRNLLCAHSSLFNAAETAYIKLRYGVRGNITLYTYTNIIRKNREKRASLYPISAKLYTYAQEDDQPTFIKDRWLKTEQLLTYLSEQLDENGITLVSVGIPSSYTMSTTNDGWHELVARYEPDVHLVRDYAANRLEKLFQKLDAPFIPLLNVFDKHRGEVLPYWHYHLNPNGHRLVAEEVFRLLEEEELIVQHN